jgi:hypothetical protein
MKIAFASVECKWQCMTDFLLQCPVMADPPRRDGTMNSKAKAATGSKTSAQVASSNHHKLMVNRVQRHSF